MEMVVWRNDRGAPPFRSEKQNKPFAHILASIKKGHQNLQEEFIDNDGNKLVILNMMVMMMKMIAIS
jgi:hypothetical protein